MIEGNGIGEDIWKVYCIRGYSIGGKFDFRYWEDPSTVYDDRVTGGHYINVTEFVIDNIAQDEYMRMAHGENHIT